MSEIKLDIIDFNRCTFSGPVQSVTVPGVDGELTILPNHIPFVTPLKAGEVVIRDKDNKETYLAVGGGFLTVDFKKITLLVDSAEHVHELDEKKIQEAKARAEKLLQEKKFESDRAFADATALLDRSLVQLKVLQKRKKAHH